MGPEARREYVMAMRERYGLMNRQGKGRVLDEFCAMMACHRKHAIRALNAVAPGPSRRSGPTVRYGACERQVLKAVWLAADQPCGKRLVAALPLWLPAYGRRERLSAVTRKRLLTMSAATADRLLAPERVRLKPKGLCGTRPGSLLKTQIPIRGQSWDEQRPGYLEADTVAHCGPSLAGDFVWSLTFTDIATGWTANRAVWNRGAVGVLEQLAEVETVLPFTILGFDCDNGSEFLNHHLWAYLRQRKEPVDFTRSRPYHKNDQAYVEQKNYTHVRQLLGYERLGWHELVEPINVLYRLCDQFRNAFLPVMKLASKSREGTKIKKRYDPPQTPLARILDSPHTAQNRKRLLREEISRLDPFDLKDQIETQLRQVFSLKRRLESGNESMLRYSARPEPGQVPLGNVFP